jgi:hypothetical protein
MNALVKAWAQPLVQTDTIHFESKVFKISPSSGLAWQALPALAPSCKRVTA